MATSAVLLKIVLTNIKFELAVSAIFNIASGAVFLNFVILELLPDAILQHGRRRASFKFVLTKF